MSLWDKYKVKNLPLEEQAEVIKTAITQEEETKRARIGNSDIRYYRLWMVGILSVALVIVSLIARWAYSEHDEKNHTGVICPSAKPQSYKLVPVTADSSYP